MPATLTVRDELTTGAVETSFTLEFLTERITLRELIRERVYQEVQDYNRRADGVFRGLVRPTDAETHLNGYKLKAKREVTWQEQFDRACGAFTDNRILVLIGDRQAASLDEEITITRGTEITFLKLVPLVGG